VITRRRASIPRVAGTAPPAGAAEPDEQTDEAGVLASIEVGEAYCGHGAPFSIFQKGCGV